MIIRRMILLTLMLITSVFMFSCTEVKEDPDVLRVALTGKYPPFSMYDADGELVGFDVDVSRAVAGHLGRELELVATEWDGILPGLLANKYDAIIGSMAITEERQRRVNFSQPYYESGAHLFIHEELEDEINSIYDCEGRAVGVVLGETFEHYLRENHPEINITTYKSTVDIFQDVANRRLVGFVSDKLLGAYQIQEANQPFVPAGDLLYTESMAIPVMLDNDELLNEINNALNTMRQTGELDRLFDKWFGLLADDEPVTVDDVDEPVAVEDDDDAEVEDEEFEFEVEEGEEVEMPEG